MLPAPFPITCIGPRQHLKSAPSVSYQVRVGVVILTENHAAICLSPSAARFMLCGLELSAVEGQTVCLSARQEDCLAGLLRVALATPKGRAKLVPQHSFFEE